ncbi:hypothetical protein ACCO45_005261 [Purpureocillium lilacinum]|uniref:Uncharacterized protein n=1 Tax=Purpureocillium lilacinum TaxID=33203 RepID=A0ACC4DW92_PURLI
MLREREKHGLPPPLARAAMMRERGQYEATVPSPAMSAAPPQSQHQQQQHQQHQQQHNQHQQQYKPSDIPPLTYLTPGAIFVPLPPDLAANPLPRRQTASRACAPSWPASTTPEAPAARCSQQQQRALARRLQRHDRQHVRPKVRPNRHHRRRQHRRGPPPRPDFTKVPVRSQREMATYQIMASVSRLLDELTKMDMHFAQTRREYEAALKREMEADEVR